MEPLCLHSCAEATTLKVSQAQWPCMVVNMRLADETRLARKLAVKEDAVKTLQARGIELIHSAGPACSLTKARKVSSACGRALGLTLYPENVTRKELALTGSRREIQDRSIDLSRISLRPDDIARTHAEHEQVKGVHPCTTEV